MIYTICKPPNTLPYWQILFGNVSIHTHVKKFLIKIAVNLTSQHLK